MWGLQCVAICSPKNSSEPRPLWYLTSVYALDKSFVTSSKPMAKSIWTFPLVVFFFQIFKGHRLQNWFGTLPKGIWIFPVPIETGFLKCNYNPPEDANSQAAHLDWKGKGIEAPAHGNLTCLPIYGNWLGMDWKGELMKCNPEGGQVAFCCTMAIFWAPANLESYM